MRIWFTRAASWLGLAEPPETVQDFLDEVSTLSLKDHRPLRHRPAEIPYLPCADFTALRSPPLRPTFAPFSPGHPRLFFGREDPRGWAHTRGSSATRSRKIAELGC